MINTTSRLQPSKAHHYLSRWVLIMAMLLPTLAHSSASTATLTNKEELVDKQLKVKTTLSSNLIAIQNSNSIDFRHDLSAWGMFNSADWVVKTVMLGLAIASLLTWSVLLAKSFEFAALKRLLRNSLSHMNAAHTLKDAKNDSDIRGAARDFIAAAEAELRLSKDLMKRGDGKSGVKERVASSVSRVQFSSSRNMLTGTGLLATIGSVAPFVGLLGTVWGIMNSFIGIARANTTNLAVVAPGIAEALLATALGLVAAIPAVVIYNHFTRQIASAKALSSDNAAAVLRLVSRDLDRETSLQIVRRKTG
ncbi:MAG: tonB-system energizer ExbB [Gammaproteobacteria bacterium]|nr:tonB-system energizer ExbB [Gammaproteobacteria bacterium]